jgi:hypothetical protein
MEIMDPGAQLAFLWRLVDATQQEKVKWESNSEFAFKTRIGRFGYVLTSVDDDDFAPFSFAIYRFESKDSSEHPALVVEWGTVEFSRLNDPLQALYSEVKPRVMGFHTIVGDMFEDLAALDGGPEKPGESAGA